MWLGGVRIQISDRHDASPLTVEGRSPAGAVSLAILLRKGQFSDRISTDLSALFLRVYL